MVKKIDPREEFCYEDNPESVMVFVCGDWFPLGTYSNKFAGFPMSRLLKMQLDYMIKNVVDDWDFTLLICGEGEVRIGKSTLAQQISTYWTWSLIHILKIKLPHSVKENMVFNGSELIKQGNKLGRSHQYSTLIFDEAGADLEGVKAMKQTTQAVRDYLRECGQYNMLNILVLPEFFDLPKGIAISRAIAMINVYWLPDSEGNFTRGFFKFYNKPDKKLLYLKGKKNLDYNSHTETFYGKFPRFYTYNEEKYKEQKRAALKNREKLNTKEQRQLEVMYALLKLLKMNTDWTLDKLKDQVNSLTYNIKISKMFFNRFIKRCKKLFEDDEEEDWENEVTNLNEEEDNNDEY